MPPLYDRSWVSEYERRLRFDDVELPERFPGGGGSSLGKEESAERFYADGATRARLDGLVQGEEYDLLIRRYRNGELETERG